MNLHLAIKISAIHVAIRPWLLGDRNRFGIRSRSHEFEREHRIWEQPFIAASNLVKFDLVTDDPVYETRVYNYSGAPIALVLANQSDDWEPLDRGDPITMLSDLAGVDQLVARQRRITDRKKQLGMREGKEWNCRSIPSIYAEGEEGE